MEKKKLKWLKRCGPLGQPFPQASNCWIVKLLL
jgi:hypothetical protein